MTEAPILAVVTESGLRPDAEGRRRLKAMTGKRVEIREAKRTRSLDQNAWIWGVAYPEIAEALGYEPHEIEELHYGLIAKWGGEHFDKRLAAMVPNKRSSKLTTKEFSDYMQWLARFGAKGMRRHLYRVAGREDRGMKQGPFSEPYRRVGPSKTMEHIVIVERALGHSLPAGAEVHHVDGNGRNNANSNLVACQDKAYHKLLHKRMRIKAAGGNPNTERICQLCRTVKPLAEMVGDGRYPQCRQCARERAAQRRERRTA